MTEKGNSLMIGGIIGVGLIAALAAWQRHKREFDLAGKTVLITGGSRGLGLVLAREFASKGAQIAICARDGAELERAKVDLESRGATVFDAVCDVRNQAAVIQLIEAVTNHFGSIDVLVNNAGVIQVGALENQTQKDFEDAMQLHFWGAFYTMQAVIPQMKRRNAGRIINISSIGGKFAVPHLAPYCASKFALVGLSDAMRGELAKDNISVTTVCPGLMRTGSHINAYFKGQNELEFAWFSLGNALPFSSISAENAAKQIVKATENGEAELIISPQAKLAAKFSALFPETTAEITALVNRILPAAGGIGEAKLTGIESTSSVSPSLLTKLADTASQRNNELKPNETLA
jgi:NAD(P)-dependent dehydrogenase (short-subunit alcohol dehydrogenase family)